MATRRRTRFVNAQLAWMVATVLVLALTGSFSYGRFFTLSLLGLLAVMSLTAPTNVAPKWRSRLRWLAVLGLVGFGVLVVRRLLEIVLPAVT